MIGLSENWRFTAKPHLSVDTETRKLGAHIKDNVFLLQWAGEDFEDCCTEDDPKGIARFLKAVAAVDRITMANAGYDVHNLRESGIIDFLTTGHEVLDVQTLGRVVLPERGFKGYKLKQLGVDLMGADADEEERELKKLGAEIGLTSLKKEGAHYLLWQHFPRQLEAYGMQDVRLTHDLFDLIVSRASPQDLAVFMFESAVQRELLLAEQHGVLVDKVALAKLRVEVEARIAAAAEGLQKEYEFGVRSYFSQIAGLSELREVFEGPVNASGKRNGGLVGSASARAGRGQDLVAAWLAEDGAFEEHVAGLCLGDDGAQANQTALRCALLGAGVPLYRTTDKSGQLATNKDALAEFEDEFPIIGLLFEWRAATKMLATYVEALERADPRVHANFLSCEARTSRMSCRSPNMQNLPRGSGARDCIIPAPGNALLVLDFDSIEVRILAHYLALAAKHTELRDAVEGGLDAHTRTAVKVYSHRPPARGGPPFREMSFGSLVEHYGKGGGGEDQRTLAKETTFSSMYGIGEAKLSRRLGVARDEAREIKKAVLGAIEGYWDLIDALKLKMRQARHLKTVLGRRLDVPVGKTHVYLNSVVQGSAAEAMKLALLAAAPRLREVDYQVILVVHDELVAEGPADRADEALDICRTAMETVSVYFACKMKATGGYSTDSYAAAK